MSSRNSQHFSGILPPGTTYSVEYLISTAPHSAKEKSLITNIKEEKREVNIMVKKKLKMTEKKVHIFFKNFAERVYHSQKYINVSYYSIIREKQ